MGVYIDMEMPKNCWGCPCYHHKVDDGYYDYDICKASGTVFNDRYASVTGHKDHIDPFKARLENCPLVPVPEPHGRLGDLNALYEKFARLESEAMSALKTTNTGSVNWIKWSAILTERTGYKFDIADAPTIIPADPAEED